jgi:putative transposase
MYHTLTVQVKQKDRLYKWCNTNAHLANNLYNAALFRQRQMMSVSKKEINNLTPNELEILNEVKTLEDNTNKRISTSGIMSYTYLDALLKYTKNNDYYAEDLAIQTAQNVLKEVCGAIKGYFASLKSYKSNPIVFSCKPKFPNYKRKKGATAFKCSNQDCVIRKTKKGNYYCKLPKTKEITNLGKKIYGKLIEVHVTPVNGRYELSFVFDDEQIIEPIKSNDRIIAIDPGINNLMAVTNNCDLPCMLFNGKPLKSINQLYNKVVATIVSRNTIGSTDKFVPNKRFKEVTLRRNNQVKDFLFKSVKVLMNWCVENRIDTIILGKNTDWKQETNIGKVNNQNFVQIPLS